MKNILKKAAFLLLSLSFSGALYAAPADLMKMASGECDGLIYFNASRLFNSKIFRSEERAAFQIPMGDGSSRNIADIASEFLLVCNGKTMETPPVVLARLVMPKDELLTKMIGDGYLTKDRVGDRDVYTDPKGGILIFPEDTLAVYFPPEQASKVSEWGKAPLGKARSEEMAKFGADPVLAVSARKGTVPDAWKKTPQVMMYVSQVDACRGALFLDGATGEGIRLHLIADTVSAEAASSMALQGNLALALGLSGVLADNPDIQTLILNSIKLAPKQKQLQLDVKSSPENTRKLVAFARGLTAKADAP